MPRPIAAIAITAIVLASAAALLWPQLSPLIGDDRRQFVGQTRVGVITRQIEGPGMAARISAVAPDFEWVAPDGSTRRLSGLRGKTVVINFWATWCVPCRAEMPTIERVAKSDPDLVVLAVDLDEDGGVVRAFLDELRLERLEPLLDVGLATSRRYNLASVPSTYFVGPDGTVRHIEIGEMDEQEIRRGIAKTR